MLGLGGRGTFDANAKADARGVRVNAERDRVVAGSGSDSSLEGSQICAHSDARMYIRSSTSNRGRYLLSKSRSSTLQLLDLALCFGHSSRGFLLDGRSI